MRLYVALAALLVLISAGWGITSLISSNKALQNKLTVAAQVAKQTEKDRKEERRLWELTDKSAGTNDQVQTKIVTQTITLTEKVPVYVHDQIPVPGCVSYGLVRVLDAAALGAQPEDLPLPAGVTDDTCSPLKPSDLARGVAKNYGLARQNAGQLDGLIADVKERMSIINEPSAQ